MKTLVATALFVILLSACSDHQIDYGALESNSPHPQTTGLISTPLYRHNGTKFEPANLVTKPEYFILYFSASWCGPCRSEAPQLLRQYREWVESDPRIELIHISEDQTLERAAQWAAQAGLPWLTVVPEDVKNSGLKQFKNGNFVPDFTLVTAEEEKSALAKKSLKE